MGLTSNTAAREMGKKGGRNRAKALSGQRRREIARMGGLARAEAIRCPWCGHVDIPRLARKYHAELCPKRPGAEVTLLR